MADNQPHLVQIRVRHTRSIVAPSGRPRFLVGVEFLKLSPGIEEAIVRYMEVTDGGVSAEVKRGG
jgi:hypothetical protein